MCRAWQGLKARNTKLEGDTFEFVTGYDTILQMGAAIKDPITPELVVVLKQLAISNGATPAAAALGAVPVAPPVMSTGTILEILLSLSPSVLKTVNLSVDAVFFGESWAQAAPQRRYAGKPTSWASKETGSEEIRLATPAMPAPLHLRASALLHLPSPPTRRLCLLLEK